MSQSKSSNECEKLIEAARNAVPMMKMAWKQYGVGGMFECMDALRSALPPASPAPAPAPAPAKGVRCWRHENGPKWFDGTDRVRLRADGRCEWVWPDGRTELCIGVFRDAGYWQDRVVYDDYVECPDATFTAELAAAKALIAHNVDVIAARDATIKALDQSLGNLLAIIHRDGGHYYQQHGHVKAVEDAHAVWSRLIQSRDVLEAKLAAQPAAGVDKVEAKRCVEAAARSYKDGDTQSAVAWAIDAIAALAGGKAE